LLDHAHNLGLREDTLTEVAAGLGSDVPFFLRGGTALGEGHGERITPLPDAPPAWIILVVPPFSLPEKTRRMYAALIPDDFTDGARTQALADHLLAGGAVEDAFICNAFERAAYEAFPGLAGYREWILEAGVRSVHLAGAGPALFALASGEPEARAVRARMNRARRGERVHVLRTVTSAEATLMWED
jgi:4-diphosphocytidyl-2-C-methyl-D-erythritol kinase